MSSDRRRFEARKQTRKTGLGGRRRRPEPTSDSVLIYGLHAVAAALLNPKRSIRRLHVTDNATNRLAPAIAKRGVEAERATPGDLDRLAGAGAVHQGVVLETTRLPTLSIEDIAQARLVLVLDQVTDPHNVGAVLRSAAAFGVAALVVTERHSPTLSATIAKTASGGLEYVSVITVTNLARGLAELGELGFTRIGLAGEASQILERDIPPPPVALVLGAEDKGLRRLTREHCDTLRRIATWGAIGSLNVSNAAAIALHAITTSPNWTE